MKYRLLHGGLIATWLVLAVFLVFHATNVGALFYRSSQPNRPASALRSFEIVPLETASETSSNASIGDLNGDGHLDIVLVKGRHWQLTSRVFFADGKGHFTAGPPLPSDELTARIQTLPAQRAAWHNDAVATLRFIPIISPTTFCRPQSRSWTNSPRNDCFVSWSRASSTWLRNLIALSIRKTKLVQPLAM
jgi:hypothetical protein